ncbi:PspC domain-containing protein [Flavobacteriaceae bacterium]|nr:PspC domain-containing protein [Flavobacteriaceae bacterium]MDB4325180.1 PspC domain-containing protein [Flavobacteriaceae bacterium]
MKKTVNINLAGTFFHIDEDAFAKLSRYLEAVKKSISDPVGGDEIIQDIEARIAELFSERLEINTQVISTRELDAIIKIMGQPEDYIMDEDAAQTNSATGKQTKGETTSNKQLFRDSDNKFIAGVCSGLSHYLGLEVIWVRLFWIFLSFVTTGFGVIAYLLFWILVPGAETTSEKLKMTGEPINISNIEKKFNEGYQKVSQNIKNVDYDKYEEKIKKGSATFFDSLGAILSTVFKIGIKLFGLLIVIAGLLGLISILIGMTVFGTFGIYDTGAGMDIYQLVDTTNTPIWIVTLIITLLAGIPLLLLFILGLKIMFPNIRSIGTPVKITLTILWIAAISILVILGARQAIDRAFENNFSTQTPLTINMQTPLKLSMYNNEKYSFEAYRRSGLEIKPDTNGNKVLYSSDIRLIVRSTDEKVGKIVLNKIASGKDYKQAKARAQAIDFNYNFNKNTNELILDGYFLTDITNKYRDQQIEVILYLPVNTRLIAATNTRSFHKNEPVYRDILILGDEEKTLLITPEGTQCLDCIEESNTIIDANIQAPSPPTPPVPIEPVVPVNTNQN